MKLYRLLKHLGGLRDGILVVVSLVYIIGYCVWSVLAWRHNLGPLPVLDAQYFAAGLPVVLVLLLLTLLIYWSRRLLLDLWPKWLAAQSMLIQLLAHAILMIAALGSLLVIFLLRNWAEGLERPFLFFLPLSMIIFVASLFLQPQRLYDRWLKSLLQRKLISEEDAERLKRNWGWIFFYNRQGISNLYLVLLLIGAAGIALWVNSMYFRVPQEFGGGRPRCAHLDISLDEISSQTREHLGISPRATDSERTVSSAEVTVYFVGTESVLLGSGGGSVATTELPRQVVKAFRWCEHE